MKRVAFAFVALLCAPSGAAGQMVGGTVQSTVEGYAVHGREARRPGLLGRLSFAPTMELAGAQLGLSLTLDSEDSFSARSLNRYGMNPRFKWGEFWLGDHSPQLGPTVLEGTSIRGAGLSVGHGLLRVRVHGGRAEDAAFTDPLGFGGLDDRKFNTTASFTLRRSIAAALVTLGGEHRQVELVTLWAADSRNVPDSVEAHPQANLLAGLRVRLASARGLRVRAEITGALHTPDTRTDSVDFSFRSHLGLPGRAIDALYTLRTGTVGDAAWLVEAETPWRLGTLRLKAEELGPGFVSLGIPSLPNDWRNVEGSASFTAWRGTVSGMVSGGVRTDGVLDPGAGPTWRGTGTGAVNVTAGHGVSVAGSAMLNRLERRAAVDTFGLVNVAQAFSVSPRWEVGESGQSLSLSGAWQVNETRAGILAPFGARALNATLTWEGSFAPAWRYSVAPTLVKAHDTAESHALVNGSVGLSFRPRGGAASGSFSLSAGQTLIGNTVALAFSARAAVGRLGDATARVRGAAYGGPAPIRELQASVGITRSFP
jgi:hypothetical protein